MGAHMRVFRDSKKWSVFFLLALAACAKPPVTATTPIAKPATAPARDDWEGRTWEDKYDLMSGFVLPNMSALFQRFYEQPDPVMTCLDCHGEDAEQVAYRMPNKLPRLDPRHMPDPNEDEARFMYTQVTPTMQKLLGRPPFDPTTKKGFGCFSCHPSK
jgi:hypothetical protein